jgi:hypothetical protein
MTKLVVTPNIDRPDDLYAEIIRAHEGKSDAESMKINARLILVLANHIGDLQVIEEAVAVATSGMVSFKKDLSEDQMEAVRSYVVERANNR